MADQFVAEIRIFPYNFAPSQWAFCAGQIMPISQNTALFSLLGTYYGGDGKSTYALPNLQGRVAIASGQGPGLSDYVLGEEAGVSDVTLLTTEVPGHTHTVNAVSTKANKQSPAGNRFAADAASKTAEYSTSTSDVNMAADLLNTVGGGQPHNNLQPYLTLNYCIALQGIFPPRG